MRFLTKTLPLLLIALLAASSLTIIKPALSQAMSKPSVPEFTVRYVDNSYDVPPTYGIDQYTGKNVTVQASYHVDNRSVEFTIKNQQFTPYTDSNGNNIKLFHNFRWKGNYGDIWTYYPLDSNGRSVFHYGTFYNPEYPTAYAASNSSYTVLSLSSGLLGPGYGQTLPEGVQVNFQVQALVGYFDVNKNGYFILTGETSDWSNTQTVTIGQTSTSTSPSPTTTVAEFSWLAILPLFAFVLAGAVLIRHKKTHSLAN